LLSQRKGNENDEDNSVDYGSGYIIHNDKERDGQMIECEICCEKITKDNFWKHEHDEYND